eukprot:CAMPEP_0196816626 /NCGR_PEP_ID=MMETSP1362-20130617/56395_1 /TAXON_ID=163516 /ORGANISM="Leptocylindrus danicus, Strain CCMP1856" /LENGTH=365 /DNA_ID=CAMNT_0042194045 /DNA_START=64 /DNA_END=1158 /DNA_ORIENTATION=-
MKLTKEEIEKQAMSETLSPCANVRRTAKAIMNECQRPNPSVRIDNSSLDALADKIVQAIEAQNGLSNFAAWDEGDWHYIGDKTPGSCMSNGVSDSLLLGRDERVALYVLTLDALNFCFWPTPDRTKIPYEVLAVALRKIVEAWEVDGACAEKAFPLSPDSLAHLSVQKFEELLRPHMPVMLPELEERCRLLNELGRGLIVHHEASAMTMIQKAGGSAELLVSILLDTFPGFRDACVTASGRQAFFYKRAQITVADLWAAFQCLPGDLSAACDFYDCDKITTFADYRVPQLLRHYGVLVYSDALAQKVDSNTEIPAGSMDEIYIRAGTVVAVDRLVDKVKEKSEVADQLNAIQMDWHLWQVGEKMD